MDTHTIENTFRQSRKPGRKKRDNNIVTEPSTYKLTPELIERLGHYAVNRSRIERRKVTKSEVVELALDEFLKNKGF